MKTNKLPSKFQIDDEVMLVFPGCGEIKNATISKIHFSVSKVMYDVIVGNRDDEANGYETRIHNIDSVFVHPAE